MITPADFHSEYAHLLGERPVSAHRPETLGSFAIPVSLIRMRCRIADTTRVLRTIGAAQ